MLNDELERIWKETTHVLYCSTIHMDERRTKKILIQESVFWQIFKWNPKVIHIRN